MTTRFADSAEIYKRGMVMLSTHAVSFKTERWNVKKRKKPPAGGGLFILLLAERKGNDPSRGRRPGRLRRELILERRQHQLMAADGD